MQTEVPIVRYDQLEDTKINPIKAPSREKAKYEVQYERKYAQTLKMVVILLGMRKVEASVLADEYINQVYQWPTQSKG